MARDAETAARLNSITEMAALSPEILIGSAAIQDPLATELADRIGKQLHEYMGVHKIGMAASILSAAGIGYALGLVIDTEQAGSGEALDLTVDMLAKVLRFSAERGFAESRENRKNG